MKHLWTILFVAALTAAGARGDHWTGTFHGEFIGDTSGSKATSFFLPTCRIGFTIRIIGCVQGDRFVGFYDAEFTPALKTFDPRSATEIVKEWSVEHQEVQYAQGTVVGLVRFPAEKPRGKDLEPRDEKQQRFLKRMAAAIARAMDRWKAGARVDCSSLHASRGEIRPGDLKSTAPLDAEAIFKDAVKGLPLSREEQNAYRAAARAVADAVNAYSDNYSGTVDFPAGAAVPGPQLPPTPNTPQTVAGGTSSASDRLSQEELTRAFKQAVGDGGTGPVDEDTFALLAQSLDGSFARFEASNQIMGTMGSGPVPSFGEKSPVGPVVNGRAQGGRIQGGGFPVDAFDDPDRDLGPPTTGPDGHRPPGAPETPRLVLTFQGMPGSVKVKIGLGIKASRHNRALRRTREVPLGLGFFAPGAKIHQEEFVVPFNEGVFKGRIDREIAKPSLMRDGVIKEIARSELALRPWRCPDLPGAGLGEEGTPPRNGDGSFQGPDGETYESFLFSSNSLVMGAGSDEGPAGPAAGGTTPVTVRRKGKTTALYAKGPLPAGAGSTLLADLSLEARAGVSGEGTTPLLSCRDGRSHLVPLSGKRRAALVIEPGQSKVAARVTLPLSPWTRRTFTFTAEKPITLRFRRETIEVEPAVAMTATETRDGSYEERPIQVASPKRKSPVRRKPVKKKKVETLATLGAPEWCPGDLPFPAGFSWSSRNGGGDFVKRDEKTIKVRFFQVKGRTDQPLSRCRDHFAGILEEGWTGPGTGPGNTAVYRRPGERILIKLEEVGDRTGIDFRIEGEPRKPPARPASPPTPGEGTPEKPLLSPEGYARMVGRLILTVEPLITKMRSRMAGAGGEQKMVIAMTMGKEINAAVKQVHQSFGVDQAWVKSVEGKEEYKRALADYLENHPEVKKASDRLKRR